MDGPLIIADAFVITCDAREHGGRMSILIRDGRITDLSLEARVLKNLNPDAAVIDARQMLVVPGLVNAHFHPESLLFRDLTSQKPSSLWKRDRRFQERCARIAAPEFQDDLLAVHAFGALRLIRSGVTTVGQTIPPVGAEQLALLIRSGSAHGLRTLTVLRTWEHIAGAQRGVLQGEPLALSLGSEEELTALSLENIAAAARELGLPLVACMGEMEEDAALLRRRFGKELLAFLRDFGVLDPMLQLVHLNHGSAEDLRLAAEHGVPIILAPRAAAVKQTGYSLLRSLEGQPVPFALGTDWGETDILREMTFLADMPYLFAGTPGFEPLELLRMATIRGARALGFGAETGSIERGKQADLVFFGLKPADLQYVSDVPGAAELASVVLTHLTRADIVRVMAHGQTLYAEGRCTQLDETAVTSHFRRVYASMAGIFLEPPSAAGRARIDPLAPASRRAPVEEAEGDFEEGFTIVPSRSLTPAGEVAPAGPQTADQAPRAAETPPAPALAPSSSQTGAQAAHGGQKHSGTPGQTSGGQGQGHGPGSPPRSGGSREVWKPELSKNVRRVFGDDDDPAAEREE